MPLVEPSQKNRYRLYIDESGDHAFNLLEEPSHRFLALCGVWFFQKTDYVNFADNLEQFKRNIFGPHPDKPVILHRSDIINKKGAFGVLQNAARHEKFNNSLLELVAGTSFKITCIIIDKKAHQEKYCNPFHPYHYCLTALMERYCGWLNYKTSIGDIMAESRGKEEDIQLKQAYKTVYESGTRQNSRELFQTVLTSKDIKIQPKTANIAGLQLADILAHPVKQSCLAEQNLVSGCVDVFGGQLCKAVQNKFNSKGLTVWGYGKKIL